MFKVAFLMVAGAAAGIFVVSKFEPAQKALAKLGSTAQDLSPTSTDSAVAALTAAVPAGLGAFLAFRMFA